MIFLFEINYRQHVSDQDGNESCQRCAGHSQSRPRTNSENQQRREDDVEQYAEHLEPDGRFNDSGGAQRRAQRHQRKLEQKSGKKPEQISFCQCRRRPVRAQPFTISRAQKESDNTKGECDQDRHDERLIKH